MTETSEARERRWPALEYEAWADTCATLHRWTQIVGKIRLKTTPWINHSWHVTLYPTARGLSTGPMFHPSDAFQADFDFVDHRLRIATAGGGTRDVALQPRSVADFYREVTTSLTALGVPVHIDSRPNEVEDATPFEDDERHASYDADAASRFWRVLLASADVFTEFRARFVGKCSPVHFFWGSCDLAVTRFSGRTAPPHPGGVPNLPDRVAREAYSHEVSSAGFWPGGPAAPTPVYYAYAYPEPQGFADAAVSPSAAFWEPSLREFVLPYDEVRRAATPEAVLLEFLQSTYEAAADRAGWDRDVLETDGLP